VFQSFDERIIVRGRRVEIDPKILRITGRRPVARADRSSIFPQSPRDGFGVEVKRIALRGDRQVRSPGGPRDDELGQKMRQVESPGDDFVFGKSEDVLTRGDGVRLLPMRRFFQFHGAALDSGNLPFRPAGSGRRLEMMRHRVSVDGFARPLQSLLDAFNAFFGVHHGNEGENGDRQERMNAHDTNFKEFVDSRETPHWFTINR